MEIETRMGMRVRSKYEDVVAWIQSDPPGVPYPKNRKELQALDSHVYAQLTASLSNEATRTVADDFYRNRGGGGGGPPGPRGDKGEDGADGRNGRGGKKGDQGDQGDKGDKGDKATRVTRVTKATRVTRATRVTKETQANLTSTLSRTLSPA